ncbi:MAG TPA: hypothetical protein VFV66_19305 [Nonomuraea sp.]|nr:hypothetical protein [Nonomuraea sp.]
MDAEDQPVEGPARGAVYTEEQRAATLAALLDIMGGRPPADMLELVRRRDEEFTGGRTHVA